jgi:hypothetical protein
LWVRAPPDALSFAHLTERFGDTNLNHALIFSIKEFLNCCDFAPGFEHKAILKAKASPLGEPVWIGFSTGEGRTELLWSIRIKRMQKFLFLPLSAVVCSLWLNACTSTNTSGNDRPTIFGSAAGTNGAAGGTVGTGFSF